MIVLLFLTHESFGACGGTVRTWAGTTTAWTTASNWSGVNVPDTAAEDAVVVADWPYPTADTVTVGCFEVQSGTLNAGTNNKTLTVKGDYFSAPYQNSINITANSFTIVMSGTAAQSLEAVDTLKHLTLSNPTTVTLKNNFGISGTLTLTGSGTTIVEGIVQLTSALTIPAGHRVIIKNGGAIYSAANLTVSGTLEIQGGGELRMANTRTLSVPSGGALEILGSSGNAASVISSNASSWFTFTVAGSVRANYAVIQRVTTNGMNVTGTIIQLDNTDFRGMVNSGYVMTLGSAAVVPANLETIGFYNDDAVATPKNINANAYNLGAVNVNMTSGSVAGAAFELDPNAKINWPSTAPTQVAITDDAEANEPTATLAAGASVTFAEFAFTLNKADTATNITQVILTMTGSAAMSDLGFVRAYRDTNANCDYDAGTDTQIGSDLVFTGSPLKATVTIPSGQVTTNSSTQQGCLLVVASAGAAPVDQRTVSFSIVSSGDVTNSQSYPLSSTSGPPISSGTSTLVNPNYTTWDGFDTTSWNWANNWSNGIPTNILDCRVGLATRTTLLDVNPARCGNATLLTNGTLDFNNTSNVFEITNSISVGTSFNFLNAASATITMKGTVNQTLSLNTLFPGHLIINNTGTTNNNTVSVGASSTINGNLTCTAGILSIGNGITLTALGTVTIQTGCTISIAAGGTLALGNNRTLTVNSGGKLQMVGSSGLKAIMTSNTGSAAYNVVVNGTIEARYYSFDHLNTTGVSIEAGATIDTTNYLQDGTFFYPVSSSTTLLRLKRQIPGNALSNMIFSTASSGATSITNIDTTGVSAGTLAITTFSGDVSGETYDTDPTYAVNWTGELNTIAITQEATSPTTVLTGTTYNMGRFGFKQVQAGGSYVDANITTLALSLTGTGSSTDITAVTLYSDASCSGTGGTLIGTGTFSGNPAKVTFTITPGALVVPAHAVTTVKVCAYVEYQISTTGTNGSTVGVKINASSDFVNSQLYPISTTTSLPVTLGTESTISAPTTTTWTGASTTAWALAANWTAGVPTSTVTCTIPNVARDPIISAGTASCKNINLTDGILVINAANALDIYGDFNKTAGTLTNNGTLSIKDGGTNINHNISSNTAITNLTLAKTGTGFVYVNQSSLTINALTFSSATTTFEIPNAKTLVLPNGVTIAQGTLNIASGGILEVANATTITVSGGTFKISGTNDAFPQSIATKGIVQVTGGGTNSYNFTATSGTVNLTGFQFDRLGVNGLNIGGTTSVANLRGGQFTNLSTTYGSVKAIQFNNTGSIPATATNVAWTWGAFNSFNPANANTPTSASAYKLISSTGCGSQTIDFTGWTGDWYESQATFDVRTKISTVAACTINMGASASAVSILFFDAIPFNNAIDLRWRTNAERMHLGFNVYRTDMYSAQFQQVNQKLIRNLKSSGSNQASYRFIDQDVVNGKRYYYYIEDVETNGRRVLHGPVSATAMADLGNPPANNPDENSETNPKESTDDGDSNLPSPAPIPNPSYEDLGNGIKILSKTSKSIRIEISPGQSLFSVSPWNPNYQDVSIPGYSKMTLVGSPELPEKDIMIEVQSYATTAQVIKAVVTEGSRSGYLIAPAPDYSLNADGVLIPSYLPNPTRYEQSSFYPSTYFKIQSDLVSVNKTKFLKLKINPMKLNPVSQVLMQASKIILDVGLDGDDWDVTPPTISSNIGPYSVNNALKIDYSKSGVYQISFEDLVNSEVEGPFLNMNTNEWRLYYHDTEIPLEIHSQTGIFAAGDTVRFYAPYKKENDSRKNQLILSPVELTHSDAAPKRMESLDADPQGRTVSNEVLTEFTKTLEQNLKYIDGVTLGDSLDHFFYADLVNYPGMDTLTVTTALPEIDVNNSKSVLIKYHVRGRLSMSGLQVKHHVLFSLGGIEEGEAVFEDNERQVLTFEVSANRFVPGNNSLALKVAGSFTPANENDFVLVDKIEIVYRGFNNGSSGINQFSLNDALRVHQLSQFPTQQIDGYDVTYPLDPKKLSNMSISSVDGNVSFDAHFFVDDKTDDEGLKSFSMIHSKTFLKPSALSLNAGIHESLKNSANRADLIIYGSESLLMAAQELIERRISQGLEVMTVTPAQVYGEFSFGVAKSGALKDFINTALTNWEKAPRFLLILGDSTYDPMDYNVQGLATGLRSAQERSTLPAPLIPGRFIDFSSDNFFVSSNHSHLPRLSVGRLPSNDPNKIKAYINKIQNYEDGEAAPTYYLKKITFFADEDTGDYEKFNQHSKDMMSSAQGFSHTLYDRTELGSKALTKSKMNNEFNFGPLMISMMGHGAFDRFGDDIFNVTDARLLNNQILPIVANWNCESAYFYDANNSYKSLAEELIFNPNGGAIAYLGSTTQTTPPAQAKLAQNFFSQLSSVTNKPWSGLRFGDLLFQAKLGVGAGSYEKDIVNSFSIIGDPSLKLPEQLFPESAKNEEKEVKKGLFGCSANAGEGAGQSPWHEGFLEWALYMLMIVYGTKKLLRKSSV